VEATMTDLPDIRHQQAAEAAERRRARKIERRRERRRLEPYWVYLGCYAFISPRNPELTEFDLNNHSADFSCN
jgi:hypothetical protein